MLKTMRERTKVVLWIVIVGFVGFIFAVWGAGLTSSRKRKTHHTLAEIAGQTVDYEQFNRAYRRALAAARRSAPTEYSEGEMSRRVLEETWNEFLSSVLLRKEVARERIKVFNTELLEHVISNPPDVLRQHEALQTDGEFDHDKYLAALRTPGQDWRWLEGYYASALPLLKLQRRVEAAAYVARPEQDRQLSLKGRKVSVAYLHLDPGRWELLTGDEAEHVRHELEAIRERAIAGEDFATLASQYTEVLDASSGGAMGWVGLGEMAPELEGPVFALGPGQISDVILSSGAYQLVMVEEVGEGARKLRHIVKPLLLRVDYAEVERYYGEHEKEFRRPALARVKFVSVPKVASSADSAEVEAEVMELAQGIAQGEDFAELASVYSDAASASQGGDLGFVDVGTLRPEFEEAVAVLSPGQISRPFLTAEGWQLLKLEEKKREKGKARMRLRHLQMRVEPSEETLAEQLERLEDLTAEADQRGFASVVAEEGMEVRQSGAFPRGSLIPGLGTLPRGAFWAHEVNVGDVSQVLETDEAFFVLVLTERTPEGISPLGEVRSRIEARLRIANARERAREQAEGVRQELLAGKTMQEMASVDTSIAQGRIDLFGPQEYLPEIGAAGEFHGAAFAVAEGQYSPVVEGSRGFYVLALLSAEATAGESTPPEQSSQMLTAARARLHQEWFSMLVGQADVKDYRDRFYVL